MQQGLPGKLRVTGVQALPIAFRVMDLCLTHVVYLEAIAAYLSAGGGSRGGVMVLDAAGQHCGAGLDRAWSFRVEDPNCETARKILEVHVAQGGQVNTRWTDVRPIPRPDGWFEQMWAEFRSGKVYSSPEEECSG